MNVRATSFAGVPLTKIKWKVPERHFCTASSPFLATSYLIFFFLMNVVRIVWLMGLSGAHYPSAQDDVEQNETNRRL